MKNTLYTKLEKLKDEVWYQIRRPFWWIEWEVVKRYRAYHTITEEDAIDWWLKKFHNTNMNEVRLKHYKWDIAEKNYDKVKDAPNDEMKEAASKALYDASIEFYDTYAVTEKQYNKWREWFIRKLMKMTGMSRKYIERKASLTVMNVGPKIKNLQKQVL